MGKFVDWLFHDDQQDLFEFLVALVLNLLFLALVSFLLWPLDLLRLAVDLLKGYGILWLVTWGMTLVLHIVQRGFRVNLDDHASAYMFSNLAVDCILQIGWAAFVALTIHGFASGAPIWVAVILYLVGLFSCIIAFYAVSSFYQGTIYKVVSLPLALIGYLVFSLWPAGGAALFGWFFRLF